MKHFFSFLLVSIICSSSQTGYSQANLIYFNGAQVFQYIDLTWGTSSEVNTDYFTIERGLDGVNFTPILTSIAAGNSSSNTSYVRTDSSAFLDTCYYYRLKVTMFNGSFSYLDTISVCYVSNTNGIINNNTSTNSLTVFPNPVSKYATIITDGFNYPVTLNVYDGLGRLIQQELITGKEYIFNRGNLTPGVYFVKIGNSTRKLIICNY